MKISAKAIVVARVLDETPEALILHIPKSTSHEFKLSEDSKNNRFYTVMFVKDFEGSLEPFMPPELKGLMEGDSGKSA